MLYGFSKVNFCLDSTDKKIKLILTNYDINKSILAINWT